MMGGGDTKLKQNITIPNLLYCYWFNHLCKSGKLCWLVSTTTT